MKRKQGIAAIVTGALILMALLAVFAVEISNNQAQSRQRLESQAHQRAVLVSGLIDAVFAESGRIGPIMTAEFSMPKVRNSVLQKSVGTNAFVALVGARGQVLAHSSGFTASVRAEVAASSAVKAVVHGETWALGDAYKDGGQSMIDLAAGVKTPEGLRIRVTGMPLSQLSPFIADELHKVPGVAKQHQLIVDGSGTVLGSTVADRPAGYAFHTATQLRALDGGAGIVHSKQNGVRYFDSVAFGNSGWHLILSVPVNEFFSSVSGFHHSLPWIIFVAFGLVAIVALFLVQRSIQAAERVRFTNELLTQSNSDLGTAQKRLEQANGALARSNEELERQASELVRSNTELDQFASIASHDLQEPLRKVRTFTERIVETEGESLSERGSDYLRRANASAERMQILIEDLLRFSRVSTQGQPFSSVDLAAVTRDVLEDLSEQVNRVSATVEIGTLPTINADAPQMRQLIQNLVSNALKFRLEGVDPIVRVNAEVEQGWMTLTVSDNGIGFDPQYSRRIFRVFERLHGRGTYPGTGIGLALCRKIAERHGGSIAAQSAPGEGATFTVTMQTQRTEAVSDAKPDRSDEEKRAAREEPYVAV